MKHKLTRLILIAGLFFYSSLQAQEKKTITLADAIDLSIKNSNQLKISQAKIEEATAALKEAVQKKLPDANVSGSYLWLPSANFDLKTKSNNSGTGNSNPPPKVSQAMYGILNVSLPVYEGGKIRYGIESS